MSPLPRQAASLVLTACLLGGLPVHASKPSVIVIISDDAGYADFGFMNGPSGETSVVPTPHLDALAARGVTFARADVAANCQQLWTTVSANEVEPIPDVSVSYTLPAGPGRQFVRLLVTPLP